MIQSSLESKFLLESIGRKNSKDFLYRLFQDEILNSHGLQKRGLRSTMTDYNIVLYDGVSGGELHIRHGAFGYISLVLVASDGTVLSTQSVGKPTAEIDREFADQLLTVLVTSIES